LTTIDLNSTLLAVSQESSITQTLFKYAFPSIISDPVPESKKELTKALTRDLVRIFASALVYFALKDKAPIVSDLSGLVALGSLISGLAMAFKDNKYTPIKP